jgi:hypothetical protein
MKIENSIALFIERQQDVVILRSELANMGSPAQVGRVLSKFVRTGMLVRVSIGIYARTRPNRFTGRLAPAATFEAIAAEVFRKLGIDVTPSVVARDYNAGKSTQIPMAPIVNTGRRRISRKIQVGSRAVIYERTKKSRSPSTTT